MADFHAYKYPHCDEAYPAFASLLVKQSAGWIAGQNGRRLCSSGLRFGLFTKKREESWLLKLLLQLSR